MLLLAEVAAVADQVEQVDLVAQAAQVMVVMEELLPRILVKQHLQILALVVVDQVMLDLVVEMLVVMAVLVSFSSHILPN
tara:strand:+ start:588 stop:827 length:240 start_codon:yes stop_codon:yes gene_type:complete